MGKDEAKGKDEGKKLTKANSGYNFEGRILTRQMQKKETEERNKRLRTDEEDDEREEQPEVTTLDEAQLKMIKRMIDNSMAKMKKEMLEERRQHEKEIQDLKKQITALEDELEGVQKTMRKKNLIIQGIPEDQLETKTETVKKVMELLNEELGLRDEPFVVTEIKRIGKKTERPRRILVTTERERDVETIMRVKSKLKQCGQEIYINRDVSPRTARKMAEERRKKKQGDQREAENRYKTPRNHRNSTSA